MKNKFKNFINHFLRSELLRNTSVLVSGTVIAQLIPILLRTFLSRHFSPEAFGAFSVYTSCIGILIVVSSFRYEQAILLPKKDKDSINLVALSFFINLIFCFLLFFIVLLFHDQLLRILNIPENYSFILYLIPLGTFLFNSSQNFNFWLIRKKAFFPISVNKFVRRGVEGFTQVVLAFVKDPLGLVFGDIFGQFSNIFAVIYQSVKSGFSFEKVTLLKIKYVSRKYSEFPRYNLIPSFMSACSFLLPALIINKNYSSEMTGYFDQSKLLLSVPFALVASSLASVLLQKFTEMYKEKKSFWNEIRHIFYLVTFICFSEILIISFFGIGLFKFIFGYGWGFSGEISKILVWSYALNFFVSSFSSVFISMRRIKTYSVWQVIYFVAIITLFFFKDLVFIDFIKLYVLIEVICYTILAGIMIITVLNYEQKIRLNHSIH